MQRFVPLMLVLMAALPEASWAVRVLEQLERSYELSLSDVQLPRSTAGAVVFKACTTCNPASLAVTAGTLYRFNKQLVTLSDLQQLVAAAGQAAQQDGAAIVAVYYDIATNIVTRITVNTRNAL